MSEFKHLDTSAPAQMGTVVEAVLRLSTMSESELLALVSQGQLRELFPFRPNTQDVPADFAAEEDLREASALPLSRKKRASLIQSSMPPSANANTERSRLADALALQEKVLRSFERD